MEISGLLMLGFTLTLLGVLMVYQSLRARPGEVEEKDEGVIFFGTIPIIVGGSRKWIVAALGATAIMMLFILTKEIRPDILGC
ncbi:MAG: DUF131 domain-containing protein [Candidatus Bathyarchaeota archaeon]|nr:DUF131 domain-containing protein [Candidatus Bathyarchaeota archaeon]